MQNEKRWYKSKGVWGSVVTLIIGLGTMFGWDSLQKLQAEQDKVVELIVSLATTVGGIFALWGRVSAKDEIKKGE